MRSEQRALQEIGHPRDNGGIHRPGVNRTAGNTAHTGNALGRIGNGEVIVGDGSHGAFPCTESAGSAIGIDSGNQPGPLFFAVMLSGNWWAGIGAGSEFFEDLLAENGQLLAIGHRPDGRRQIQAADCVPQWQKLWQWAGTRRSGHSLPSGQGMLINGTVAVNRCHGSSGTIAL